LLPRPATTLKLTARPMSKDAEIVHENNLIDVNPSGCSDRLKKGNHNETQSMFELYQKKSQ
jgi:hypothetical protein